MQGACAIQTTQAQNSCQQEYRFEGDDEIVDQVNYEMALKRGEIKEVESDDEEEDEEDEDIRIGELMCLCEKVEHLSLKYGDSETSLDLSRGLRQFRIHLRKVETSDANGPAQGHGPPGQVTISG